MRHSSEEARQIAAHVVLRCEVGSTVHGVGVKQQDDRDEMGMCIEAPQYVVGVHNYPEGFQQYIYRTKPEGARSGPGDLDLVIYSLRKWMRLALQGNPSVLLPLFVPESAIVSQTDVGRSLRACTGNIVSKSAGRQFAGYLKSQRDRMLGLRGGMDVNRPELVEAYGFDTKYAAHMVRLGIQGVELLKTGRFTVPVPEPWRTWIVDLRVGKHTQQEALDETAGLEAEITALLKTSHLPDYPDRDWANRWLVQTYLAHWEEAGEVQDRGPDRVYFGAVSTSKHGCRPCGPGATESDGQPHVR